MSLARIFNARLRQRRDTGVALSQSAASSASICVHLRFPSFTSSVVAPPSSVSIPEIRVSVFQHVSFSAFSV